MPAVFLVSDTHFGHAGVCRFTRDDGVTKLRPWTDPDEMDEEMVKRWNETVKPNDKVYHLGDVVISTAILRDLKMQLPNCKVDFLVGDWAAPILKDHPGIHQTFYISHWHADRSEEVLTSKKKKYHQLIRSICLSTKKSS